MSSIDITYLIEKNAITRLNKEYSNKLINKIQENFTKNEQRIFVSSFYCYLNYDLTKDFIIDFDTVWKWCGFSRKGNAKTLLEKHFIINSDYQVKKAAAETCGAGINSSNSQNKETIFLRSQKNKNNTEIMCIKEQTRTDTEFETETILHKSIENKTETRGRKEDKILLSVNTFKKFCLKANTKKADEIHDYYIKLEELLQETINEESEELRKQLTNKEEELANKDKKNSELNEKLYQEQCLVAKQKQKLLYQQEKITFRQKMSREGCIYVVYDPCWSVTKFKIGCTSDFNERVKQYRTLAPELKTSHILYTPFYELFEQCIKIKFSEFVEQPSHEIYIMELNDIINGLKEINKGVGFNAYEEKELWKINNEQEPNILIKDDKNKSNKNSIIPVPDKMRDSKIYVEIIEKKSNKLMMEQCIKQQDIKEEDIEDDDKIKISSFLPSRLNSYDYKLKNNESPEGMRYCNSFCRSFQPIDNFEFKSTYMFTSCKNCQIMETCAIAKIKQKMYTSEQIAMNPNLVFLNDDQKLCPYCKEIKHEKEFRKSRQQCSRCKNQKKIDNKNIFRDNIEEEIDKLYNDIKNIETDKLKIDFLNKYNKDNLFSVCKHIGIKRLSSDRKVDMIDKLLIHLHLLTFQTPIFTA